MRVLVDRYVRQARAQGYVARSAFKLQELQQRFGVIPRGASDIAAAQPDFPRPRRFVEPLQAGLTLHQGAASPAACLPQLTHICLQAQQACWTWAVRRVHGCRWPARR